MLTQRAKEEIVQTKVEVNELLRYLLKKNAGLTSGIEKARTLAKVSNLRESSEELLVGQAVIASTEILKIRHLIQETGGIQPGVSRGVGSRINVSLSSV